jgi:hypothetical protein
VIEQPGPTAIDFSGRILVLRGGTLLVVFARAGRGEPLAAARSMRAPRLPAVQIGSQPVQEFVDPQTGVELPQAGFPRPSSPARRISRREDRMRPWGRTSGAQPAAGARAG